MPMGNGSGRGNFCPEILKQDPSRIEKKIKGEMAEKIEKTRGAKDTRSTRGNMDGTQVESSSSLFA